MSNLSRKIPIAIMGVGKIAIDQHIPTINNSPDFEFVATISKNNAIDGVPNFSSIAELVATIPEVKAIAICTPPQVRCDYTIEALKLGLHVMMEKPPTSTLCEFNEILAIHAKTELTLFTAWHSRYAAKVEAAKDWLAGRDLNDVNITWRESALKWHPGQQWLWDAGGLGIFDPAINAFSIVTKLLGHNIRVEKANFETPLNQFAPIAAKLQMRLGNLPISADLDFREKDKEIWEIYFSAKDGHSMKLIFGGAAISIDSAEPATSPDIEYKSAYAEFVELIKNGKSNADNSPQRIVADAFVLAKNRQTDSFFP